MSPPLLLHHIFMFPPSCKSTLFNMAVIQSTKEKTWHPSQLSTVNCHLLTLPNNSQEMFPGSLHSVCQSISGKILFSGNFLKDTILLTWDLHQFHDISWQNFPGLFCHEIFNENVKKFFQTFLTSSLTFYCENSKSQSLVTCHLSPVITCQPDRKLTRPAACRISFFLKSARFGKSLIKPVPVDQFSIFQWILGGDCLLYDMKF